MSKMSEELERLKSIPMKYKRMAFNAELQSENNALREKLAAVEKDAARYRLLRDPLCSVNQHDHMVYCIAEFAGDKLDAAIDAAMESTK